MARKKHTGDRSVNKRGSVNPGEFTPGAGKSASAHPPPPSSLTESASSGATLDRIPMTTTRHDKELAGIVSDAKALKSRMEGLFPQVPDDLEHDYSLPAWDLCQENLSYATRLVDQLDEELEDCSYASYGVDPDLPTSNEERIRDARRQAMTAAAADPPGVTSTASPSRIRGLTTELAKFVDGDAAPDEWRSLVFCYIPNESPETQAETCAWLMEHPESLPKWMASFISPPSVGLGPRHRA